MRFIYITSIAVLWQQRIAKKLKKHLDDLRCYHHNGMKPQTIGRALGIGVRVAGRVAGQRLAEAASSSSASATAGKTTIHQAVHQTAAKAAGLRKETVARGVGGFLAPFRRVGGILWLEVTGSFFFIFALAAGMALWRTRPGSFHGPYNKNFLAAAGMVLVFAYLGVSSFWRAREK